MSYSPNQLSYYSRIRKLSYEDMQAIREAFDQPLPDRPTMEALARQYNVSRHVIFRAIHTTKVTDNLVGLMSDETKPDPL
jgi:hypothetical protein